MHEMESINIYEKSVNIDEMRRLDEYVWNRLQSMNIHENWLICMNGLVQWIFMKIDKYAWKSMHLHEMTRIDKYAWNGMESINMHENRLICMKWGELMNVHDWSETNEYAY